MEFSAKDLGGSRREIEVTILATQVQENREKALGLFQKDISLQGFRQGHVPKDMVRDAVLPQQVFAKAVELSVQEAYRELRIKERLEVLGEPEIHIVRAQEGEPLIFRIVVSLFPSITLPDYKQIASRVKKKEVAVHKEELDKTLQWLQESKKKEDGSIPELTDEFAKSLGNFPGAQELKKSVEEGLLAEKKTQERNRMRQEIVATIAKEASVEVPEVLVHREEEALLLQTKQGIKSMLGKELPEYLQEIQKTHEEFRASLLPQAQERIRQFLVLDAIAKKEKIMPSKQEVEQEAERAKLAGDNQLDPQELLLYSEGVVRNEKTLQFLEGLVK